MCFQGNVFFLGITILSDLSDAWRTEPATDRLAQDYIIFCERLEILVTVKKNLPGQLAAKKPWENIWRKEK